MKLLIIKEKQKIKTMKKFFQYIFVFCITVGILFLILILTAKIPKEKITNNLLKTSECLKIKDKFVDTKRILKSKEYTTLDTYADVMLLNIIYNIDTQNTLQSTMEAKYYSPYKNRQITSEFNQTTNKSYRANVQYMRYWHGSMSIIRPLLVFFNLGQIYIINAIILTISAIILLIMLIKTRIKELVVAYIIGLIICTVAVVPFCLEYFWTFLIMFIVSIISIILDKKDKKLNNLFFIIGIITCYLDFLSTEIITFLVPILIILTIRYKENRLKNFKEGLKFLVILSTFWGIGYIGMWITKWILASIILKVNALDYVLDELLYRLNAFYSKKGLIISRKYDSPVKAIERNIAMLFPIDILAKLDIIKVMPICILLFELSFIKKQKIKDLWFSFLLLIIASIPYIRYAVLSNHSYVHYFFTFRSQIISIMAIFLSINYSIDKSLFKKKIKIKNKKNN